MISLVDATHTPARGVDWSASRVRRRFHRRVLATLALSCIAVIAGCGQGDRYYNGRPGSEWLAILTDTTAEKGLREDAADALGHILAEEPSSTRIVGALITALGDSDDRVRLTAGHALVTGGVRSPEAVLGLTGALRDTAHADVRAKAADLIGQFGAAGASAVPALVEAAKDPDPRVRLAVATTFGRVAPIGEVGVGAVSVLLDDSVTVVRVAAASTFAQVARPEVSVPALTRALGDSAPQLRAAAAQALGQLEVGGLAAVAPLTRALDDSAATVRAAAAAALGALGPVAQSALPRLSVLAGNDRDPGVVASARGAVASIRGERRAPAAYREPSKFDMCGPSGARRTGC